MVHIEIHPNDLMHAMDLVYRFTGSCNMGMPGDWTKLMQTSKKFKYLPLSHKWDEKVVIQHGKICQELEKSILTYNPFFVLKSLIKGLDWYYAPFVD